MDAMMAYERDPYQDDYDRGYDDGWAHGVEQERNMRLPLVELTIDELNLLLDVINEYEYLGLVDELDKIYSIIEDARDFRVANRDSILIAAEVADDMGLNG